MAKSFDKKNIVNPAFLPPLYFSLQKKRFGATSSCDCGRYLICHIFNQTISCTVKPSGKMHTEFSIESVGGLLSWVEIPMHCHGLVNLPPWVGGNFSGGRTCHMIRFQTRLQESNVMEDSLELKLDRSRNCRITVASLLHSSCHIIVTKSFEAGSPWLAVCLEKIP